MSKALLVAVAAITFSFIPVTASGQEHLPAPCANLPHPPPASFRCPSPYVEMETAKQHESYVFERAWHCRETGHTLGQIEEGCGGGGLDLFDGWIVPAQVAADTPDYTDEIIEHVVMPCFLDMAMRNPIDGVTPEQTVKIMMARNLDIAKPVVDPVNKLLVDLDMLEERLVIYRMSLRICLEHAREA